MGGGEVRFNYSWTHELMPGSGIWYVDYFDLDIGLRYSFQVFTKIREAAALLAAFSGKWDEVDESEVAEGE